MKQNQVTLTDSYKVSHDRMYPDGTQYVSSYFEARKGAHFPKTMFFGLQILLKDHFLGVQVTKEDIDKAEKLMGEHLGEFNRAKWDYIVDNCGGKLPIKIRAVAEGTQVPVDNVLFNIINTDPNCYWLVGHMETVLTHVWHSSTVATLSKQCRNLFEIYLEASCDEGKEFPGIDFMLHDFGYRGATCIQAAQRAGMGHLVNFSGTDTIIALEGAMDYYNAPGAVGFSVNATEHSVMTSRGREGEIETIKDIITKYPNGILSMVSDSYDIFNCVENIYGKGEVKEMILARDGVFVIRPDSGEPVATMKRLLELAGEAFGFETNKKGFKVLNPKVRIIWGDGIGFDGIGTILEMAIANDWSAENLVFGMGGGLHQKVDRDTQRCAFKSSAQMRNGEWHDIFKDPLDQSKRSKRGQLKLIKEDGQFKTVRLEEEGEDILETVFLNGDLVKEFTFDEVRANAK
jgi:nicotinamide phosphoribosyltransferase